MLYTLAALIISILVIDYGTESYDIVHVFAIIALIAAYMYTIHL